MKVEIEMTMKPYAQSIRVDTGGSYINIGQDRDEICIAQPQYERFAQLLLAAAREKGWAK